MHDFLEELPDTMKVVYCPKDSENSFAYLYADYLQFIAYDKEICVLDQSISTLSISDNDFLVTAVDAEISNKCMENYVLLYKTPHF